MYATLIERKPAIYLTTQQEREAIMARDAQQRESQADPDGFAGYEIVDAAATERAEAKVNGWPIPPANWHVHFFYRDFTIDTWTEKEGAYRTKRIDRMHEGDSQS